MWGGEGIREEGLFPTIKASMTTADSTRITLLNDIMVVVAIMCLWMLAMKQNLKKNKNMTSGELHFTSLGHWRERERVKGRREM